MESRAETVIVFDVPSVSSMVPPRYQAHPHSETELGGGIFGLVFWKFIVQSPACTLLHSASFYLLHLENVDT